jgi:hypothetical protein
VKTPLIFALSGTLLSPIANAVTLGTSEANLLAEKGPPISKAAVGTRAIYRWNDSEITVIDGVVTGVSNRDIQRENAERERSAKANAEQKAKLAVREATSRQETQARPARDFIIDEKTIQARKSKVRVCCMKPTDSERKLAQHTLKAIAPEAELFAKNMRPRCERRRHWRRKNTNPAKK